MVPVWALTPLTAPCAPQASSEKPKRPISAMFIFSEEKRKQLQEERPELSESELTRLLARMWNDLSEKKKVGSVPVLLLQPLSTAPVLALHQGAQTSPWSIAVTCHTVPVLGYHWLCLPLSSPGGGQNPPDRETSEGPRASILRIWWFS